MIQRRRIVIQKMIRIKYDKIESKNMKHLQYEDVESLEETTSGAKGATMKWMIGEKEGAKNFTLRVGEIVVGGNTPFHTHQWEHEVFVVEGKGRVFSGGEEKILKEGDAVFIPPDEKHQFFNAGEEIFKFVCVIPNP